MDNKIDLTVEIVSAYVSKNTVRHDLVPQFIRDVHAVVAELAPTPETSADSADLTGTKELLNETYMFGVTKE